MGRKAVGPVCCVTRVKETSALIEKRRGLPQCSWFDWQHIVSQQPCKPLHCALIVKRSPKYLAGKKIVCLKHLERHWVAGMGAV